MLSIKKLGHKIIKVIKTGALIIIICINCIIVFNINDGVIYANDTTAAEFHLEDDTINASNFQFKDNVINASEFNFK